MLLTHSAEVTLCLVSVSLSHGTAINFRLMTVATCLIAKNKGPAFSLTIKSH